MTHISRLLSPDFVDGLDALPMGEVRERRHECQDLETGQSYVRRLVQGRLDIVHAEIERREQKTEGPDLERLVSRLGVILGDHVRAPASRGQLAEVVLPDGDIAGVRELNDIIDAERVGSLHELSDVEVRALARRLDELERSVSMRRRVLHERIDALQGEIVKRYKSGEASVDALLR